jgi:phosphinothricin acetyltransferase
MTIRIIQPNDTKKVLDIYTPYVKNTAITFEYDVPSEEEYANRIKQITAFYPFLVSEIDGQVVGFTYANSFRPKAAYQWSTETTIYLNSSFQGRGLGTQLYLALFSVLKLQGFINAYAGVAIPNDASIRLHKKTGFKEIGKFNEIGYKLGAWHTTQWFELALNHHFIEPAPVLSIHEPEIVKQIPNLLSLNKFT